MNTRRLMYKLQNALYAKNHPVRINLRQTWNDESKRMFTLYIVIDDSEHKTLIETFKTIEVVKVLAELLVGGDEE